MAKVFRNICKKLEIIRKLYFKRPLRIIRILRIIRRFSLASVLLGCTLERPPIPVTMTYGRTPDGVVFAQDENFYKCVRHYFHYRYYPSPPYDPCPPGYPGPFGDGVDHSHECLSDGCENELYNNNFEFNSPP